MRSTRPLGRRTAFVAGVALAAGLTVTTPPASATAGLVAPTAPSDRAAPRVQPFTTPSPLRWTPCGDGDECATLLAPLTYRDPGDRIIPVALRRRAATDPARRAGTLVVNPGGPGEAGTLLLQRDLGLLSSEVRARFDVLEMDPRGVGASLGFHCEASDTGPVDPVPADPTAVAALTRANRSYAAACARAAGPLLAHVGTVETARDLETLRQALGEPTLTFLGISYGTLLGATYADLYPTRVRAMVLDGAIDPARPTAELSADQAVAMQRQLDGFLATCARGGCGWPAGADPHAAFADLASRLRTAPLRAGGSSVGVGELYGAVLSRMYSPGRWPSLAAALAAAARGDGSPLSDLDRNYFGTQPGATINADASTAINCLDHPVDRDVADQPALAATAAARAPEFGPYLSWGTEICAVWPARATRSPHAVRAAGSPPILVVGTTDDPATPYSWAQSLSSQLDHGVLLTRHGTGHTGILNSSCVRDRVSAYLATTVPPPAGSSC
ncbi:MAG: alpha/beta hydrolase [Acidimicrobiia bacterium]